MFLSEFIPELQGQTCENESKFPIKNGRNFIKNQDI